MAWQDQQDQEKLRKNNGWDDFWGGIGSGINDWASGKSGDEYLKKYKAQPQYQQNVANRTQQAANTSRLPGMTQDNTLAAVHGKFNSRDNSQQGVPPGIARPAVKDPMDKLMERRAQLEAMLDEDYTGDPEIDSMIEQAYTSALSNVSGARSKANDNFAQSDANIAALSAGHVATIKGEDMDAVKRIGGELQSGYQKTFDTAKGSLEADRTSELEQRTAMLQRLGIQEAGLGTAGQGESEAIQRLTENQAGAVRQAQGYQAADEVRNTELASSQASAGVERRSALNKDLQGILGNLDQAETELGTNKAQAKLQAYQSGKSDYNQRLGSISDSINDIDSRIDSRTDADRNYNLDMQKLAQKNSGGGGVMAAVGNSLANRGIDPAPYLQTYADVSATETFNAAVDGDKKLWLIRQMKKRNPKLDSREIQATVLGVENYGTDKL